MNNKLMVWIIIIAVAASMGFFILNQKMHRHEQRAGLIYYCPMHPEITSDKPGECPICYMKLVLREDKDGPQKSDNAQGAVVNGHAAIDLDLNKQQLIGVKTAPVKRQKLVKKIRASGTVAHDPELFQVQAEYIQSIQALQTAREKNTDLENSGRLERLVEASRTRLRHLGLSEEMIAQIATWKEPQHSLLFAHPGQPVWVYAQVYEYELPLIHVGDKAEVSIPSLQEKIFKGQVRAIDQLVDQQTRTVRVRIELEDADPRLRPETYVNAFIFADLGVTLLIPREAVFDTGEQKIVFVDAGDGVFEPRAVVFGAKTQDFYEVKSGLTEGELVVTSGNFLIDSESRLKSVLQGRTQEKQEGEHAH